jgi:hypothetical protein
MLILALKYASISLLPQVNLELAYFNSARVILISRLFYKFIDGVFHRGSATLTLVCSSLPNQQGFGVGIVNIDSETTIAILKATGAVAGGILGIAGLLSDFRKKWPTDQSGTCGINWYCDFSRHWRQ